MAQTHVINSLQLEMDVADQDMAFRLRNKLSGYWQEWLVSDLEKACENISGEDEVIRLDRLEIDLGELEFEELEEGFSERLQKIFTENLVRQIGNGVLISKKTDRAGSDLDLLQHFLENGSLPWWSDSSQKVSFDSILAKATEHQSQELKRMLEKVLNSENQCTRLLYQFDIQIVVNTFSRLYDTEFLENFIKKDWLVRNEAGSCHEMSETGQSRLIAFFLIKYIQADFGLKTEGEMATILDSWREEYGGFPLTKQNFETPALSNAEHFLRNEQQPERHFIRHAGIILAAPFLSQLFKNLNLLAETGGAFRDEASAFKAAGLIGYLADFEENIPEYQLVLAKAICGLDLALPIPQDTGLSDSEKEEAKNLLEALVEHWTVLKSVDGLQKSFLQREGILYNEGSVWKLRVEKKAFDVLLDHKPPPWGFRLLSFSWNKKLIETEW